MSPRSETIVTHARSVEETVAIGAAVGRALGAGDVVTLDGVLGAGKTQMVRGLAIGMGMDPRQVSSPTFVFMQEYLGGTSACVLVHVDAYRLSGPEELESIGWSDELCEQAALVVEWPSRIAAALPEEARVLAITLDHVDEHTRRIEVIVPTCWRHRLDTLRELMRDE